MRKQDVCATMLVDVSVKCSLKPLYTLYLLTIQEKRVRNEQKKDIGHTMATSILVILSSSSGQTRYPRRTHSRYDVTLAKSWALWKETESR